MQFNERHILSPDYMSDITVYGYTFKSLRQAYADFKAILGGRHDDWVHQRASILRTLAILKFTQNLEAAQALISTRNEELIYAPTYHDSFLGIGKVTFSVPIISIGPSSVSPSPTTPKKWIRLNWKIVSRSCCRILAYIT